MDTKELEKSISEFKKEMIDGSKANRIYMAGESFELFLQYYFTEFFTYETADFQRLMFNDVHDMTEGLVDEVIWMIFRESAKTTIAKAFVVWCICYQKKRFINYDSYDKSNAEQALFDISNWLMTNARILDDFGQLYYEDKKSHEQKKEMKRINEFITANGIKVKAYSTQTSTRGRIYDRFRPDLFIVDDFETSSTKRSFPITQKIIDHIEEMRAGLAVSGNILYLCNYITENGSVAHMVEKAKGNPKVRVRNIPVMMGGKIMWEDKFVMTDEEAIEINKTREKENRCVSIEEKKRQLKENFEPEMMNNPSATAEVVFDRARIDELMKNAKPPKKVIAGMKIWEEYNPKHRYAFAGDVAEGVGRDSSATAGINFSMKPNVVVATYSNNEIAPDVFAYEMKRQGEMYGNCLLAPEKNNQGYATVSILKTIYPVGKIHRTEKKDRVGNVVTKEFGFHTNGATKPEIIYQLKSAVEDGELVIYDKDLLNELRSYTQEDLKQIEYKDGMTRHFDKLMALAICWEMRNHAKPEVTKKEYRPQKWQPVSSYEGQ